MMYSLEHIKDLLGDHYVIIGDTKFLFNNAKPLNDADEFSICWLGAKNKDESQQQIKSSKSKIVVCSLENEVEKIDSKILIKVKNPRLVFLRIVKNIFVPKVDYSIHHTATIHNSAKLSKKVYIGPNCFIGNCKIGENVVIYGNCYLFDNVTIGNNVTIMPNTTIGGIGFGYEKNEHGEFELFPHIGGVIIEDNVDIGCNTCIDRGTLGNTIIGKGSKIDNLVHIAHNVKIGKNCAIIANTMIGGSTIINDGSWIAPSVTLRDRIKIGKSSIVGLGAVVLKDIDQGQIWYGNPAKQKT